MPLGVQVNTEHLSTRTPKESAKKWEVLQCHSHYCSHQVSGYNRLDDLHQTNVLWFETTTWYQAPRVKMPEVAEEQQLHAEGPHFLWLQSSTIWSQTFFPWGNGWREVAQHNPAERTLQTIAIPMDLLRKRALQRLDPELLRLFCKSSWACFRKTWWFW